MAKLGVTLDPAAESMLYVVGQAGSGYVLERLPGRYGPSRSEWWLCWDTDKQHPVMIHADNPTFPAITEERQEIIDYTLTDVDDGVTVVQWNGSTECSWAFREVTVDGVTWEILLDGSGYPWIIQKKQR